MYVSIGYPESLPDDWKEKLNDLHIPSLISPLHDKDVTETGEFKKPHFHILLKYSNAVSLSVAKKDFESIGCVNPFYVKDAPAMVQYFTHKNETDSKKYHYDKEDLISMNGFDIDYYYNKNCKDNKYNIFSEMIDFCDSYNCISFCELVRYSRSNRPDWFDCLTKINGSSFMIQYMKSLSWERNIKHKLPIKSDK